MTTLDGMDSPRDLQNFLKTAVRACRAAGKVQMKSFGRSHRVEHKGEIDLVTETDRLSEEKILDILGAAYPAHGCLAEESPPSGGDSGYLWVVDPLDGTTNYSRGFPVFAVSIALYREGRPLVGAVYSPPLDELFTARRGGGARLNGRKIEVSRQEDLGQGFLATGFPYDIRRSKRNNLDHFARFAVRSLAVRRAGAAALDLAYLAAGRFDGFWELKLKPWDTAAGVLLIEEAGGKVTTLSGRPFRLGNRDVVASNGLIHEQMLSVLRGGPSGRPRRNRKGGT